MTKLTNKIRRHNRIRSKVKGSKAIPRVSIFRSNRHFYLQLIDDAAGKTIISTNDVKAKLKGTKTKITEQLAKTIGEVADKAGISKVVFDRGGYKYHGRVKAIAEALRKAGLKF